MSKKQTLVIQGAAGLVALAMLGTIVHAGSARYGSVGDLEVDMAEAALVAQQSLAGRIIEAELEMEDGLSLWEIDIVSESNQLMTVGVDGQTGEILYTESDDDAAPELGNIVNLDSAIRIIKAVESGAIVEAELESEHGDLVWEIETLGDDGDESEFRVHAETGQILH